MILAAFALLQRDDLSRHRFSLGLLAATAALPLIQLIPLPPALWMAIPGREQLVLALDVAGVTPGFAPLSLTPDRTWGSFLALIPPVAVFLGVLAAPPSAPQRFAQGLVLATFIAILLGAAQLASGGTRLYPWATTDAGNVVGFFANRNHMAALSLMSLPFAVVLGIRASRRHVSRSQLMMGLAIVYVALTVVAIGVIRSRAGIILVVPVLLASLAAAWIALGRGRPKRSLLAAGLGAALAFAAVGAFALGPVLERFDTQGAKEGRFENWPFVVDAAASYLPLGSGIGSFDAVYRSVEPLSRLDATFFNQAHNDFLELWLETGWLGAALVMAFLVWFGRRTWTAWRARVSASRDLQRAATIAIATILAHSVGDYPLRTETIVTLFALCCGLLELAVRSESDLEAPRSRRRRR
ncbi:O-antigen ligase family protein [Brevundimonas sp. BR2-1]|uniref:O-antigen ligase family protein n=1 Tax=Brevundimonas sp. BR2-1 TaxID=3031123 RepID=UPI0030B7CA1D